MPVASSKFEVDAVIFDLDGTLIDSVPIYYRIIDVVFARLGVPPVPRETLQEAMDDGDFNWDYVLPADMKNRKEELINNARKIIDDIAPPMFRKQVKLITGAAEIIKGIAAEGLKLGLVTSTPSHYMTIKIAPLRKANIANLLEVIVTADDVRNKKPAADPLVKCSKRLDVAPDKCVYVGDTRVDIRAGKASGMKTVGVLTGFDDYDALNNEAPDAIISSVSNLSEALNIPPILYQA